MTIQQSDVQQLAERTFKIARIQSPSPIEGTKQKKIAGGYFMVYFVPKNEADTSKIISILSKYNLSIDIYKSSLFQNTVIRVPESQGRKIKEEIRKYISKRLSEMHVSVQKSDLSVLSNETISKLRFNMILDQPYAIYYPKTDKEAKDVMSLFNLFDIYSNYSSLTRTKDNRPIIVMNLYNTELNPIPKLLQDIIGAKEQTAQQKTLNPTGGTALVEQRSFRAMWQKMQRWFGKDNQK